MESSIVPPIYREAELDGKMSLPTAEGWEMAERLGREAAIARRMAVKLYRELVENGGDIAVIWHSGAPPG